MFVSFTIRLFFVYTEYSSQNDFFRTYQEKLAAVVMLRVERMITIKEEQFDIGALSVGLLERVLAVSQGQDRYSPISFPFSAFV